MGFFISAMLSARGRAYLPETECIPKNDVIYSYDNPQLLKVYYDNKNTLRISYIIPVVFIRQPYEHLFHRAIEENFCRDKDLATNMRTVFDDVNFLRMPQRLLSKWLKNLVLRCSYVVVSVYVTRASEGEQEQSRRERKQLKID